MIFSALRKRRNNNVYPIYIIISLAILAFITTAESNNIVKKDSQKFINSLITPRALYLPRVKRSPLETKPEECPPCFDCHLSTFECSHFANCSDFDGKCQCPPGFGGEDCSKPLCNSLADGPKRLPRGINQTCECSEGWTGINCNVCQTDLACDPLVPTGANGTCYKGGLTVNENFQMCDVTNRKILDMLPDQPPQVTFSCNRPEETCDFQFWINGTESFYCHLDECAFSLDVTYDKNITAYNCKNIKCKCREGEMLCGKDGSIGVFHLSHNWKSSDTYGLLQLPEDESSKLMADHVPATLLFQDISYYVGEKQVLNSIHGIVHPGEIMAIMGASGAGKTSFLDILAKRNKAGLVSGEIYVNGRVIDNQVYKSVVGYVDQEDHLLPTLTVYETILYSALLRLPREMSLEAKKFRVLETMSELGILEIKDSKIGETGLDAYNAYNVVECLVTLARNYNRTVVCTIHQPRSNIFALFDQLLLLAAGHMVYSGETSKCQEYFENIGHKCPLGFNIADYLVDLTMYAVKPREEEDIIDDLPEGNSTAISPSSTNPESTPVSRFVTNHRPPLHNRTSIHDIQDLQLYAPQPPSNQQEQENTPLLELDERRQGSTDDIGLDVETEGMSEHLRMLVERYRRSLVALQVKDEIDRTVNSDEHDPVFTSEENASISSHQRASWLTQFRILSDRTFKNLYRNPMLMLTHYCISVYLAILCGALYYKVTNDIAGFQNRMGVLFFMCALFGFGCLSSIHIFASERILFVKERANGYYAPITYFASKVIFDIIPLRVVPPILMGVIIYHMVGLVNGTSEFLKFILVLVLFNLTAASICLCIGILFKEVGVASLLSSLIMLFSMLFGGLFLNKESIPEYLAWLKHFSFFNYAFEALIVNEVVYLQLTEQKFGLSIDVPGATILTTFGFDASAYWTDVLKLSTLFVSALVLSFICLQFFVKEKR
ncbi:9688_t:CDS:10 [Ambispora gerdemannii]|uniref:9688_t:CDS:1 n=1 Tax=Ambispora gerdemannii TaxID=144530 RepID=A0A9N8V5H2_9GLOM|nr:9688_t:CDS:10 [Ambispora gerdemannii]